MRVKLYTLSGPGKEPICLGTLALSENRVVIEDEDPRHVGTLANILAEPVRVFLEGRPRSRMGEFGIPPRNTLRHCCPS